MLAISIISQVARMGLDDVMAHGLELGRGLAHGLAANLIAWHAVGRVIEKPDF